MKYKPSTKICIDARFWGIGDTGIGRYTENLIDHLPTGQGVHLVLLVSPRNVSEPKLKKFAKYINWKKADSYRSVGGVRIEDDVLVTKTGCTNLTHLPKEISDIEKAMKRKGKPC